MKLVFAALFFLGLASCHAEHEGSEAREIVVDETPAEVKIPVALWDEIEGKHGHEAAGAAHEASGGGGGGGGEHGGGSGEAAGGEAEGADGGALFAPVDVILKEKNKGVLSNPEIHIRLPRGGGEIDLSRFMGSTAGSFFVNFEFPENEEGSAPRVWFVSRARKRRIDREIWGAGCNKYFEITSGLAKMIKKEGGLKANTTRQRHLSVLGGTFLFNFKKDSQSYLTQVTFIDANSKQLFCGGEGG